MQVPQTEVDTLMLHRERLQGCYIQFRTSIIHAFLK